MQKKLIFKIKTGYNPADFILVDNTADLEKAIHAKIEKLPVFLGGKMISGQEIKEIEPDVHSYTGWYRSYVPESADDFAQIERDVPKVAYDVLQVCARRVSDFVASGAIEQIGREALPAEKLLLEAGVNN